MVTFFLKPTLWQVCWLNRQCHTSPADDSQDFEEKLKLYGPMERPLLIHRVDAHSVLRTTAESYPNISIHLSRGVVSVNPESGTVSFGDGTTEQGDLVIGADGVHSQVVKAVDHTLPPPAHSGLTNYRFLIPMSAALADTAVVPFLGSFDWQHTISGFQDVNTKRIMISYPCRSGKYLNCVTFHPVNIDEARKGLGEGNWNNSSSIKDIRRVLQGYLSSGCSITQKKSIIGLWPAGICHKPCIVAEW
jgi:2-polyprenyl-6-methoxyphenol hydroxylase-like FAD-dependent oxidoreductase